MSQDPWTPSTPPTVAGELADATPPQWPKVIGVIAIVFGVLGILGGLCGTLMMFMGEFLQSIVPKEQQAGMMPPDQYLIPMAALGLAGAGLAALLLVTGIGLVKQRAWSIGAARLWAVTKMVFTVGGAVLSYFSQQEQMHQMAQNAGASGAPPQFMGFMSAIGGVVLVFSILWGWALPVFMLIWLSRGKVRAHFARWD